MNNATKLNIPQSNEIRFEVTTRCNYNCIVCPREKLTRKLETMSFALFKFLLDKVMKETSQYRIITFPGMGEPLLDKDLDKKIRYAKNNKFKVLILTNGSLLDLKKFQELEKLGVDSIRVSLYGNSERSYNSVHGLNRGGLFAKIKRRLTNIAKNKKTTKLLLTYNVINDVNEADMNSWVGYWQDKADMIEVWRPHNWVDGRSYRKVQNKLLNSCGRPWRTPLQVQVDGTINMCCFDFNGKLTLGDLKTQSLKEVFQSSIFRKILRCHSTGDFKNSGLVCRNCDQRNSDKSSVMIYNSQFDISERVKMVSTTYEKVL